MSAIHIKKTHHLSFSDARKLAQQWQQDGELEWQLHCDYQYNENCDTVIFKRSGVSGELTVNDRQFILAAKLGFLLKPYQKRITAAIEENLTQCLSTYKTNKESL